MTSGKDVMAPLLSVVVSTKNRLARLTALLESLQQQAYPSLETVIIDDGSEPALPALNVSRQVRNERSVGMCEARNMGFRLARGQYIVVVDDDTCMPDPTLLARAVECAQQWPRLGAIGFRQLTPEGKAHYMQPAAGESLCLASRFFGYGFLLSRDAIEKVGSFYSPLGYYQEETELGLRLLDAGYTILYDPSLRVIHYEETANRNNRVIQRLNFRNSMCTVILRYPAWLIAPSLVRSLLRYLRLTRDWGIFSFSDTAWALGSLMQMCPGLWRDRRAVGYQTLRGVRAVNRGEMALGDPAPAE
jgi:GT2 family glycosyltransferase